MDHEYTIIIAISVVVQHTFFFLQHHAVLLCFSHGVWTLECWYTASISLSTTHHTASAILYIVCNVSPWT